MAEENVKYDLSLDEIVFQNRNKEYGAYDLRTQYPKLLTRSFLIGTAFFILLALTPLIYLKIKQLNAKEKTEVEAILVNILDEQPIIEEQKEEAPPPPPKVEEQQVEVIQNVVPEPKREPKVETPPPPITEQVKTNTGLVPQEGVRTPTFTPPPPINEGKGKLVEQKPVTNEVYESVDQSAEFAGGINSFRNKFMNSFDSGNLEGEGTLKTEITFVVERDGTLTQVKATGSNSDFNKEAEYTVKSIKGKWTPAKVNGQPVRSRFRFPVTMNFQ